MEAILTIYSFIQMHGMIKYPMKPLEASMLSSAPLTGVIDGLPQPYPAFAQQHAIKIGDAVFMPWPANDKQYGALYKHRNPVVLRSDVALGMPADELTLPVPIEKACFHCSLSLKAASDGAGKPHKRVNFTCSACGHARYCSEACAKHNWRLHKHFCAEYKAMYGNAA